jgi:hypothetical protein
MNLAQIRQKKPNSEVGSFYVRELVLQYFPLMAINCDDEGPAAGAGDPFAERLLWAECGALGMAA